MLNLKVAFAILFIVCVPVNAQAPDVPHGGGNCTSDWDCSLGGECSSQKVCACDVWFTGSNCAQLNLQQVDPSRSHGSVEMSGYFGWGGHPLVDSNGTYHLLFSFLCDHATLSSWTTKSSIAHATSQTVDGPYVMASGSDEQLVVPPWSHGSYIVKDPPTGEYLLWHLGDGTIDPKTWSPCYNSAEAFSSFAKPDETTTDTRLHAAPGGREAFVERAPSLNGPWTHFNNNTGVVVNFPAVSWTRNIDNPAPFILENGTTLLYFRAETCPDNWGALAPACIGVARGDTWMGPFTSLFPTPITKPEGEDPSVFVDPRGSFHMLTNVNTYHHRCGSGVPCGGHAWSMDGLVWSDQYIGAFGPVVRWTNGSYFVGAYAERPQIVQSADKTPIAFFTGFGMASYTDSHNFVQLFCTDGVIDCGPTQLPNKTTGVV